MTPSSHPHVSPPLPLPSLASLFCVLVPAAAELSPGHVGGGAIPSADLLTTCFPPHSASGGKFLIKNMHTYPKSAV